MASRGSDSNEASAAKFAAFLSYSHSDTEVGEWLHARLEGYRTPSELVGRAGAAGTIGKRIGSIFRDRVDLSVAHDLGSAIRTALENSTALLVLCSPRSAGSPYVAEEIRLFKAMGKGDRIFAAIIDGEPYAKGKPGRTEADECFPKALLFQVGADGKLTETPEPTEPLAADFREGRDGRENGPLKIIAGLLGVPLDELVKRHRQAERRRRFIANAIAAAMFVLAIGAGVAGGFAIWQRGIAVEQEKIAVEERDRAQNALAEVYVGAARAASDMGEYDQGLRFGVYALRLSGMKSESARLQVARAVYANQLAGRYVIAEGWDPILYQNNDRHMPIELSARFMISLAPDGSRLASLVTADDKARLWDVASGGLLASVAQEWTYGTYAFAYLTPDGVELRPCERATVAPVDQEFAPEPGEPVAEDLVRFDVPALAAVGAEAGCERARQLAPGQPVDLLSPWDTPFAGTAFDSIILNIADHDGLYGQIDEWGQDWLEDAFLTPVKAFALSPDGRTGAAGFRNGVIALVTFSVDVRTIPTDQIYGALEDVRVIGRHHGESVMSFSFSADGRLLASAGIDGMARVWRIGGKTGPEERVKLGPAPEPVYSEYAGPGTVTTTEFARHVATVTKAEEYDKPDMLRITSKAAGKDVAVVEATNPQLLAISDDDRLALVSSGYIEGGGVKVVSLETGQVIVAYESPLGAPTSGAISPDGGHVAAGSSGTVMVWSVDPKVGAVATLQIERLNTTGEGDEGTRDIAGLTFSPDGRLLAAGSEMGLQIWTWADSALLINTRKPVDGPLKFAGDGALEYVDRGWEAVDEGVYAMDLGLLRMPADQLLVQVCGPASLASVFHPSLRTFNRIEARTDRMVQSIWLDEAGAPFDVCTSPISVK